MMKSKKDKDLADELMEDLLESEHSPDLPEEKHDDDIIEIDASPAEETADVYDFARPSKGSTTKKDDTTDVIEGLAEPDDKTDAAASMDSMVPEDTKKIHLKTSVGKPFSHTKTTIKTGAFADNDLSRSENLRVAQEKILELEQELDRVREENVELSAAGETMLKRYDKTFSEKEEIRRLLESKTSQFEGEIELLKDAIVNKDALLRKLEDQNESMEAKIEANMQKIKVRARELENRLELVKMENAALLRNKNEMILDLKRNIDQLNLELEKYRKKGQELNRQLDENKDILNRTVKTLRVALTLLESGGGSSVPLKKVK